MTRHIVIITPSEVPTGPIKGAYALANALVRERRVTLVAIKGGPGVEAPLDGRVERRSLADVGGGWRGRLAAYRRLLEAAGGRRGAASISFCLSADALNWWCGGQAVTCASVRGNLVRNYRLDYGSGGTAIAAGHLVALRRFDHVVALTAAMAAQVLRYTGRRPAVISNFVDEAALDKYRVPAPHGPLRFVFVGSLTERKQPLIAIRALADLARRGLEVALDIVGGGPLGRAARQECAQLGVANRVVFHGQLADPYPTLVRADALVLPSLSEGSPRAALEALYLGVPCVLRRVDGNDELIRDGRSGALFSKDPELADTMLAVARRARDTMREVLLPRQFRQATASRQYLELLELS